jgi:hypothetical protein
VPSGSSSSQTESVFALNYDPVKPLIYSNGSWFVDNTKGLVSQVEIFNSLGHQIRSLRNIARGSVRLPTESLAAGRYLVRVQTRDATVLQGMTVR